jgi:hypothetical protein
VLIEARSLSPLCNIDAWMHKQCLLCFHHWATCFSYFIYSIPSRYEAFWRELDGFKNVLKTTRELNVEKAGIVALFGVECFAWFWTGEVVGRGGTITGYYV